MQTKKEKNIKHKNRSPKKYMMKEITLTFSAEELRELAKQLYLASTFLIYCDGYNNQEMADNIINRVCEAGFKHAPETGAFRHGGFTETEFTISPDVDEEACTLIDVYNDEMVAEHVPYKLADRDFKEKYGEIKPEVIMMNEKLLNELVAMQKFYKEEFELYDVIHLRLEQKDSIKTAVINPN